MLRVPHAAPAIPLAAILLSAALQGGEPLPIPAPAAHRAVGTLESIDLGAKRFTLASERGAEAFDYDDATEFVAAGQPIEPASLRQGDTLRVDWTERGNVAAATRVELVPPDPAPPTGARPRSVQRSTPPM